MSNENDLGWVRFKSRDVRHFINAGVALGVDVRDGIARVTVAFLNRREVQYSRPAARHHINLRFDADDTTLRALGLERNVWAFPYKGTKPRQDILFPLGDLLKVEMQKRVRSNRYGGSTTEMRRIIREEVQNRKQRSVVKA